MIEEGKQWFKFYPARWLGSATVLKMSDVERGIYIQILAACWVYGEIPSEPWQAAKLLHTNYRTTARWLQKYSHLLVTEQSADSHETSGKQSGGTYQTVQKLFDLQEIKRKSSADEVGEERRRDKKRVEEKRGEPVATSSSSILSKSKPPENDVKLASELLGEFCKVMQRPAANLSDEDFASEMKIACELVACYVGAESEIEKLRDVMKVMLTPGSYWRNTCSTMSKFAWAIMKNPANGIMTQYQERIAGGRKKRAKA